MLGPLAALDAFLRELRRCGELDGGVQGERTTYECLPDTVDPRGPKGK